jgi:excisionase family DNA binding protein
MNKDNPAPRRRAHSVDAAAEALSVSPRTMRRMIADGRIKTIRVGYRVLVPDAELDRISNEGVVA